MIYQKIILRVDRDELITFLEEMLSKWRLRYVRSSQEYRISIYPEKRKWRPFGFFLGFDFKSLPHSPIIDIILLEGEEKYTEVVFRIVRGFEGIVRRIISELASKYSK